MTLFLWNSEGMISAHGHHASLELVPAGNTGSIVAELFSFDANTGGYVVGPSCTSYPIPRLGVGF